MVRSSNAEAGHASKEHIVPTQLLASLPSRSHQEAGAEVARVCRLVDSVCHFGASKVGAPPTEQERTNGSRAKQMESFAPSNVVFI